MGTTSSPLGHVLFGRTRQRVLGWVLGHPDEAYYLSELRRLTGVGQGALQRELEALTSAGVLARTTRGRHVFFKANRDSPVFEELRSILAKTSGVTDVLRDALIPLGDGVGIAFVFGSVAHGSDGVSSDVDVLVIGDATFAEVVSAVSNAQSRLGRDINPTVYRRAEFESKLREGHYFLTSLLREPKLFIVGDADELARLAEVGMGDAAHIKRKRSARPARGARPRSARQRRR